MDELIVGMKYYYRVMYQKKRLGSILKAAHIPLVHGMAHVLCPQVAINFHGIIGYVKST